MQNKHASFFLLLCGKDTHEIFISIKEDTVFILIT